ncbi:MAG TPA: hypothetical protein VHE30_01830 [Polyangiaceae bacterium]|nr:hypothetical protein [Polyangiaceae bacterium]
MKMGYLWGIGLSAVACGGNTDTCHQNAERAGLALQDAWEANAFEDRNAAWSVQPDATPCNMNDDARRAVRDAHGADGPERLSTYERLCGDAAADCREG